MHLGLLAKKIVRFFYHLDRDDPQVLGRFQQYMRSWFMLSDLDNWPNVKPIRVATINQRQH